MTRSLTVRVILILVIVLSTTWISPSQKVSACSCIQNAARTVLESHNKAVVAYSVGLKDEKLVYNVEHSYGIEVPEQILVPRSLCNSWNASGIQEGYSVTHFADGWKFIGCSGTNGAKMDKMATDMGLKRYAPIPVANMLRFDDVEADSVTPQQADDPAKPASNTSGFRSEYAVVVSVFGVIVLLMIARKRGWVSGPK